MQGECTDLMCDNWRDFSYVCICEGGFVVVPNRSGFTVGQQQYKTIFVSQTP